MLELIIKKVLVGVMIFIFCTVSSNDHNHMLVKGICDKFFLQWVIPTSLHMCQTFWVELVPMPQPRLCALKNQLENILALVWD